VETEVEAAFDRDLLFVAELILSSFNSIFRCLSAIIWVSGLLPDHIP
jgi:hypothetical protein